MSPTPPAIDVERAAGERWFFARVVPEQGDYRSQMDEHTPSLVEVVASGDGPRSQRVELRYVHGGEPWAQRHDLMRIGSRSLVVTAQSHVTHMPVALHAQEALVAALVPAGEE